MWRRIKWKLSYFTYDLTCSYMLKFNQLKKKNRKLNLIVKHGMINIKNELLEIYALFTDVSGLKNTVDNEFIYKPINGEIY